MANLKQFALLTQDVRRWNEWRRQQNRGVLPDLRDANLEGIDLSGADLSLVDLSCANLNYANLNYAHLNAALQSHFFSSTIRG